jgi:hypothetical protein
MDSYSIWWTTLTPALKIYWALAIPFSIFFVLQMVLSLFGGGDHPDNVVDVEVETDHGVSFQFLTIKNMVGFFTIFSWTGLACTTSGLSTTLSLVISTLSGLAMMTMMAGIFYLMSKMNTSGTMKISEAVDKSGEVYLTIPAKRTSSGKIQIMLGGLLRTLDAMTDDDEPIHTGEHAKVSAILSNNILLVTSKP